MCKLFVIYIFCVQMMPYALYSVDVLPVTLGSQSYFVFIVNIVLHEATQESIPCFHAIRDYKMVFVG